ncbi:MAG: hypothetical protein ACREJC_22645 [Tepidisphaeraceae bacterium]
MTTTRILIVFAMLALGAPALGLWRSGAQDAFAPDVYASRQSAIAGVAARAAAMISSAGVICVEGDLSAVEMQNVADVVSRELPLAKVQTTDAEDRMSAGQTSLRISVRSNEAVIVLHQPSGSTTLAAAFADKPWVDDWATFVNTHPRNLFICGSSRTPCTSEEQALNDAYTDAARQLIPIGALKGHDLERQLIAVLRKGQLVSDRFVQTYDRPYGRVYNASVLLDASPASLGSLRRSLASENRAQIAEYARRGASFVGLIAVVTLLYWMVNAVTRGYFMWTLRSAALLVVAAGAVVIVMIV